MVIHGFIFMSIFSIDSSKKSSNKVRIKHDENILSSSESIKNASQNPPYYYLEFLNYIGIALGKLTLEEYYPIFSLGAFVEPGKLYGLSSTVRKYIEDFFAKTDPQDLDTDPLTNLDFSSMTDHMEAIRLQNEQILSDIMLTYNQDEDIIIDYFLETMSTYGLDEEMKPILSYSTWNSPRPIT